MGKFIIIVSLYAITRQLNRINEPEDNRFDVMLSKAPGRFIQRGAATDGNILDACNYTTSLQSDYLIPIIKSNFSFISLSL